MYSADVKAFPIAEYMLLFAIPSTISPINSFSSNTFNFAIILWYSNSSLFSKYCLSVINDVGNSILNSFNIFFNSSLLLASSILKKISSIFSVISVSSTIFFNSSTKYFLESNILSEYS